MGPPCCIVLGVFWVPVREQQGDAHIIRPHAILINAPVNDAFDELLIIKLLYIRGYYCNFFRLAEYIEYCILNIFEFPDPYNMLVCPANRPTNHG